MRRLVHRLPRWLAPILVFCLPLLASTLPATAPVAAAAAASEERITTWQAAVLGVVEGLTEYLPVSSTGHLILTGQAMGLTRYEKQPGAPAPRLVKSHAADAFEIVIQLGAILAVVGLYRRRVGQMLTGLVGRSAPGLHLVGLLVVAFLPSAIVGLALHRSIKEYLFSPAAVSIALAVGGVAMIAGERLFRAGRKDFSPLSIDAMTFRQAALIGLVQCLALWPGMSRSMVTILAGLAIGLDRVAAAEFSFLLALPTLTAATLYEGFSSRQALLACVGVDGLLIGLVVSGVVAALAVRGFVKWLTRHGLVPFGVYRILLAGVVYAYLSTR
jgi:undecaprenyl-diphosphatase